MTEARRLPLLSERTAELETCGYCPKLCRAECPVSEAERNEALTPWGKMTLAWFTARGTLPPEAPVAATAWACSGCGACTERCQASNPVADVLWEARADQRALGVAPRAAERVVQAHAARHVAIDAALARLGEVPGVDAGATTALLVGCGYLRRFPEVARALVESVVRLLGPVRLLGGCCGAPLAAAGDRAGARAARQRLRDRAGERLVVGDPGCALALREFDPEPFVDVVYRALPRLGRLRDLPERGLRWLDPCALGRGLGRFDEPRAILTALAGSAPREFPRHHASARCSGGGGLLPVTFPRASLAIADARHAEHRAGGAGLLVTGCASSLRRLERPGVEVVDLVTLVRRGLRDE